MRRAFRRSSFALTLLCSVAAQPVDTLAAPLASRVPLTSSLPLPGVSAASWLLVDGESGQILLAHDPDLRREPASLTKLMTAYVVLGKLKQGYMDWDEMLVVPDDVDRMGADESRMYLRGDQAISVRNLLNGLIVVSANDAALTLADRFATSQSAFVDEMNRTAQQLGMTGTHFTSPSGVGDNYTTARDMAVLSLRLVTDFPNFFQISSQQRFSFEQFSAPNQNPLVNIDPSIDGLKTGHTATAQYCIVATANRAQSTAPFRRRIFAVILGAPTRHLLMMSARAMLDTGFSAFDDIELASAGTSVGSIPVAQGETSTVPVLSTVPLVVTVAHGQSASPLTIRSDNLPVAPVARGQVVARYLLRTGSGETIGGNLIAATAVRRGSLLRQTIDGVSMRITAWSQLVSNGMARLLGVIGAQPSPH
ncbi:hypothetical protein WK03_38550 [Burkholderia cepacia]|nr:hypothetical protein WK03_38550 [Burkholderia cepacia]